MNTLIERLKFATIGLMALITTLAFAGLGFLVLGAFTVLGFFMMAISAITSPKNSNDTAIIEPVDT